MERKVDDDKLLEMLAEKKPQKEIAAYFGCAESYITKRKRQLMPVEEPPTFAGLTEKEKKFCLAKAEGKTNVQAATIAYDVTSPESAKAMGYGLMKKDTIQASISEIMDAHGLTKEARIKQLKTLVYHRDGNISLKALDQTWKLDGSYAAKPDDEQGRMTFVNIIKQLQIIHRGGPAPAAIEEAKGGD